MRKKIIRKTVVTLTLLLNGCSDGNLLNPQQAQQTAGLLTTVASGLQSAKAGDAGQEQTPAPQGSTVQGLNQPPATQPTNQPILPDRGPDPQTQPTGTEMSITMPDQPLQTKQNNSNPVEPERLSSAVIHQIPVEIQTTSKDCAAASMTAVLNSHGKNLSQSEVNSKVSDQISGRTDYMVQYAKDQGFTNSSHISRQFSGDSMSALEQRVQQRPQVVRVGPTSGGTIDYRYPQSLNPTKNWNGDYTRSSPNGHFMVLKGFDSSGNPMLMDPANSNLGHVVADRSWFIEHWTDTINIEA